MHPGDTLKRLSYEVALATTILTAAHSHTPAAADEVPRTPEVTFVRPDAGPFTTAQITGEPSDTAPTTTEAPTSSTGHEKDDHSGAWVAGFAAVYLLVGAAYVLHPDDE